MSMKPKSRFLGEMHEIAADLYSVGAIDEQTMREYDRGCLVADTPAYDSAQIRSLRERCNMSQAVFAATLNASPVTVQKWEQGAKKPGGMAMKLLSVLDRKGVEALG